MRKDSLLEVDFEHLAWSPVSHKILKSLPGAVKPIEMARGKNDVYIKAEWVADNPEQTKDITNFKKIFEEIGKNKGSGTKFSEAFLPKVDKDFGKVPPEKPKVVEKETPEPEVAEKETKTKSIEDLIKEMG